MAKKIKGTYSDGMSSQMKDALLFVTDSGTFRVETEEDQSTCIVANMSTVEISSRLGNTPRSIKFTNGAQFVTLNNKGLDEYLVKHRAESPSLLYICLLYTSDAADE